MMQHKPNDYIKDLATYRINTAIEDLHTARSMFEKGHLRFANNRAYYAIFHAITAVFALDGHSYKRHKDAIGNFNRFYIHTEKFPKGFASRISEAEIVRQRSDYDDFYIASKEKTQSQIDTATELIELIKEYVNAKLANATLD